MTKKIPEVNLRFPLCSWRLGLPLAFILSGIMVYNVYLEKKTQRKAELLLIEVIQIKKKSCIGGELTVRCDIRQR